MSDAAYERLTAQDLGLPPNTRLPLRFTPARCWSPLVISFPHVGLAWPPELRPKPQADFPRNADYDVHTLYERAADVGGASVAAIYSRLVADLNRAGDDVSRKIVPDHPAPRPRMSPGVVPTSEEPDADRDAGRPGRGVVWTSALGQVQLLHGPLAYTDFRQRIDRFHAPYHRALEVLLERRRERFGFAILLDAHSMPGSVGPDLVLGTLGGRACAPAIQTLAMKALRDPSTRRDELWVALNDPYLGGELVRRFGRPHEGLHALQLEVSRDLYMDEQHYRLYSTPGQRSGTTTGTGRATIEGTSTAHRAAVPAQPRHARRLMQLRKRVDALVQSLASRTDDLQPSSSGSPTPSAAPQL